MKKLKIAHVTLFQREQKINNFKIKYYKKYKEFISYLLVGALTTLVSLGSYYICVTTFLNPHNTIQLQIANLISWVCAVTFAYFSNRKFVFISKNKNIVKECGAFFLSRISTLLIDMLLMFIFVTLLGLNDKLIKLLVQFIITITNYLLSKFLVFKNEKRNSS